MCVAKVYIKHEVQGDTTICMYATNVVPFEWNLGCI